MLTDHITTTLNDQTVWIKPKDLIAISTVLKAQGGGFATIHGYTPTTDYIESPIVDINFISRFSTKNMYLRKLKALQELKFSDVALDDPKLKALSTPEAMKLFTDCVGKMVESMNKSLTGIRDDAYRQAHDLFYINIAPGLKVHLKTIDSTAGKELCYVKGYPVVDAVMLSIIEFSRTVHKKGVYKKVNSGPKVLMDNAINRALKSDTISMKTLSLKESNYTSLSIGGQTISPEVVEELGEALLEAEA